MCKSYTEGFGAYLVQKNDTCRVDSFSKRARSDPHPDSEQQESHRLLPQVAAPVKTTASRGSSTIHTHDQSPKTARTDQPASC